MPYEAKQGLLPSSGDYNQQRRCRNKKVIVTPSAVPMQTAEDFDTMVAAEVI